jgi:mannosyltransferase OCH1-like enzyme
MIPKNIHYCWFGRGSYPKNVKKCIETWAFHLPDYKFYLWNENNSPLDIPFIKKAYLAKKYAFVSDYVRFWAILNYGGIYLDTDMFLIKSLTPLLNNNTFFGYESEEHVLINGAIFGAIENSRFISELVQKYKTLEFTQNLSDIKVPAIITSAYNNFRDKEEIVIYDYDYFYPFPFKERDNMKSFRNYSSNNTYSIHLWNLSWQSNAMKNKIKIRNWIKRNLNI